MTGAWCSNLDKQQSKTNLYYDPMTLVASAVTGGRRAGKPTHAPHLNVLKSWLTSAYMHDESEHEQHVSEPPERGRPLELSWSDTDE